MDSGELKRIVGREVVDRLVRDGMRLGLGSGTTAIEAVKRLGEIRNTQRIVAVATSYETQLECYRQGITVVSLSDPRLDGQLDLAIDGADEVDPQWDLIKGRWGAMLIEKVVAHPARRFAVIVDSSKLVNRLGQKNPVPVEVIPESLRPVTRALESLGGSVGLRMAKMKGGPVVSEHGNLILDVNFEVSAPAKLEREIKMIPGVVENGIFSDTASDLLVVHEEGRVECSNR